MTLKPVFLFPGQGGYLPGVFTAWHHLPDSVRSCLEEVDGASLREGGPQVARLLLDAGAPSLDQLATGDVPSLSLAIFATEIATEVLLRTEFNVTPDLMIGHSFGEFAALTAAGALSTPAAVKLVIARDRALLASGAEGGMIAIGAGCRRVSALVDAVAERDLAVAAHNGYDQVAVSGPHSALARLTIAAQALGLRATPLTVPFPFHNPILAEANDFFRRSVASAEVRAPRSPVFSPVLGRRVISAEDVRAVLTRHLVQPVGFLDAVQAVRSDGATAFVECGARSVLTDVVRSTLAGVTVAAPL
jgi:[acyl-carrier-protein] S-malonyltransferase